MIRTIAVVAALGAVLGTPVVAQAAPGRTDLKLSYGREAGPGVAGSSPGATGPAAAVRLHCDPAGGSHPDAAGACATLRKAGGLPARIKAADTMCMMIYAPVTAEITGLWRGHRIAWKQTYGNKCVLTRATGALFTF